jgi:hypothetical protein
MIMQNETLRLFEGELNKAGIPLTVADHAHGYLGLLLGSDWRLFWDWDQARINEDEWEEREDDVRITVFADGTVCFSEPDDVGAIFPDQAVESPEQLVELLTRLANALSKETGSRQAMDELNRIFGPGNRTEAGPEGKVRCKN